jgi:hypothetical protein
MSDSQGTDEVDGGKHGGARQMADAAARAQAAGEDEQAEELTDQALRTDPDGLADALAQDSDGLALAADSGVAEDDEVAAISRQIRPHSDSPSRAGITGSGSGADSMGE